MTIYFSRFGFLPPQLKSAPDKDVFLSVVIPCYNEVNLIRTLESLLACNETERKVEVILVINSSEVTDVGVLQQNSKTIAEAQSWIEKNKTEKLTFHIIHANNLPAKHAGVGLARKIGMDEAAHRFNTIGTDGILVCYDADCTCDTNYLKEIENHFLENTDSLAASIYFEHALSGDEFETEIYSGIINYELFLRYYINSLYYSGYPHAFHTIGSSMAVRSSVYQKQGGMNKRKAGEDFYFLHKVIPLGGFAEINSTRVIPSPRASDRVPFGTGRAIQKWLSEKTYVFRGYDPEIFNGLKVLFDSIEVMYADTEEAYNTLSESIKEYLQKNNFEEKIIEIKNNSAGKESFEKRFMAWWDGFMVLKYVHFARDNYYPDILITDAVEELFKRIGLKGCDKAPLQQLLRLRDFDKKKSPAIRGTPLKIL